MEFTDGTLSADAISIVNLQEQIEEIKQESMYRPGDVVTMSKIIADGYITSGTTNAKFYIPVAKPIATEVKAITVTGRFRFRQNGKYIKDVGTTYEFNTDNGTDTVDTFHSQGIVISVYMAGGEAFPNMTNNDCVSADLLNITITFK